MPATALAILAVCGWAFGVLMWVRANAEQDRADDLLEASAEPHEHGVPFDLAGCDRCWADWLERLARAADR